MHVQVNVHKSVEGSDGLREYAQSAVEAALERFIDRVTRVEVHIGDENARKAGPKDKRCAIEVRLAGLKPMGVRHRAQSFTLAVDGATEKLKRSVESKLARLSEF